MKSTEAGRSPAPGGAARDERFEQLRAAFHLRLIADRGRLAGLRAQLASAGSNAHQTHEEIRTLSHRIFGAAALFGAIEIGNAASTLEEAALEALGAPSHGNDACVASALETLIQTMSAA